MKILITGNLGYVGPAVVSQLRGSRPGAVLKGFDTGYFAHCLTGGGPLPERLLNEQQFGDLRELDGRLLEGVDAVVHLAAISNDPMGKAHESATLEINHRASARLARLSREAGVSSFVFASSCSVYGAGGEGARTEESPLEPLTAYARSKVATEEALSALAGDRFQVTCLRFATACGMSARLRLDLVLNDFVASALLARQIEILSDGTPWRPLIHVGDMARAIDWAIGRKAAAGAAFCVVNAGRDDWNFQVRVLASSVAALLPGVEVRLARDAAPDRRSYRVSFAKFRALAPEHQPRWDLPATIEDLARGLRSFAGVIEGDFRRSRCSRLQTLSALRERGHLDAELRWKELTPS